jgi:hypothetical protein
MGHGLSRDGVIVDFCSLALNDADGWRGRRDRQVRVVDPLECGGRAWAAIGRRTPVIE